jgi:hypothetical protein
MRSLIEDLLECPDCSVGQGLIFVGLMIEQTGTTIAEAILKGPQDPVHGIGADDVSAIGGDISSGLYEVAHAITHLSQNVANITDNNDG